jgi:hypothetical protein
MTAALNLVKSAWPQSRARTDLARYRRLARCLSLFAVCCLSLFAVCRIAADCERSEEGLLDLEQSWESRQDVQCTRSTPRRRKEREDFGRSSTAFRAT